jgi:hypothetical protein
MWIIFSIEILDILVLLGIRDIYLNKYIIIHEYYYSPNSLRLNKTVNYFRH